MPDPWLYLNAVLASFGASISLLGVGYVAIRRLRCDIPDVVIVFAILCGLLAGFSVLQFIWVWPPEIALDRFLTIVLPAILCIELTAAIAGDSTPESSIHRPTRNGLQREWPILQLLWIIRGTFACIVGRILMHESIYLDTASSQSANKGWIQNTPAILLFGAVLLMFAWSSLARLIVRSNAATVLISLSLSILCTGIVTMMAGYIKGGAAAIPFVAVLSAVAVSFRYGIGGARPRFSKSCKGSVGSAAIGVGLVSLFCLIWIGRFFGQLGDSQAIAMFLTPQVCWITELSVIRNRSAVMKFAICIIAVAVPLTIILLQAKREFDEKMAPLM